MLSLFYFTNDLVSILLINTLLSNHHKSLPLNSESHTGDLTYYAPAVGACGISSTDADLIVSISHITFDAASKGSDPNANPLCRHKIRAVREGKSVDLMVVDRCTYWSSIVQILFESAVHSSN